MLRKIAIWTSYIFEPFLTSALAFFLALLRLDAAVEEKIIWGLIALVVGGLPPLLLLLYEKRAGKVKDWLITNRLERRDVHLAWFFGSVALSIIFWQLDTPRLLLATTLSVLLLSFTTTITTYFWKVSVHVVGITFLVLILLLVYSSGFLLLVALIALVAWARVYLGHHTLTQVSAAAIITIIIFYYVFGLFDLVTF